MIQSQRPCEKRNYTLEVLRAASESMAWLLGSRITFVALGLCFVLAKNLSATAVMVSAELWDQFELETPPPIAVDTT